MVTACIRQVRTDVFYVYRNLHTCGKLTFKHKDIRASLYTVYLQIVTVFIFHDRIRYVLRMIEIIDLIFRCEIVFRSCFHGIVWHDGSITCVLNSNARNLPICICVTNVTELNSQTCTIFRNGCNGSKFTSFPHCRSVPSRYHLTVELNFARRNSTPRPETPSVNNFANQFAVDFNHSACFQRSFQHKDRI